QAFPDEAIVVQVRLDEAIDAPLRGLACLAALLDAPNFPAQLADCLGQCGATATNVQHAPAPGEQAPKLPHHAVVDLLHVGVGLAVDVNHCRLACYRMRVPS